MLRPLGSNQLAKSLQCRRVLFETVPPASFLNESGKLIFGSQFDISSHEFMSQNSVPLLHLLACFSLDRLLLFGLTLVVKLLAFSQSNFAFGPTTVKKNLDRHQRHSALGGSSNQFADFASVQQEFSRPEGIMVHPVAVTVRADVEAGGRNRHRERRIPPAVHGVEADGRTRGVKIENCRASGKIHFR